MRTVEHFLLTTLFLVCLSACARPWPSHAVQPEILSVQSPSPASEIDPTAWITDSPPIILSTPKRASPSSSPQKKGASPSLPPVLKIWVDPAVAEKDRSRLTSAGQAAQNPQDANLMVSFRNRLLTGSEGGVLLGQRIYALVAPFPTLVDGVKAGDLRSAWQGSNAAGSSRPVILINSVDKQALEGVWGPANTKNVRVHPQAGEPMIDTAWKEKTSWGIVPFEELQPRWKVLRLDGLSPLDKGFDPQGYALTLSIYADGDAWAIQQFQSKFTGLFPALITNRDPKRLTVLIMTGTSGLTRGTAWYMQQKGFLYPGKDIRAWLREADFVHVSHEVSFNPKCAPPNPNDPNLRFCSAPANIALFEDVGVNVVEMTGNHLADFGSEWINYTIEMYRQRKWIVYGSGATQEQARKPATMVHNGNKIAFLGCNPAGPAADWATAERAGTANCDYPDMGYFEADIRRLVKEGFMPIVSVQFYESYDPRPLPIHYRDFRRLSDAGALIVSGSQAHLPQAMELRNQGFIHYGVSNLFFDQMDTYWPDTKDEFIDRHVFYDGKYLGVELLTARLEDYVKPRPMTAAERETLLTRIFEVSGWPQSNSTVWR